jgi:two-component system nitrate/nitrite sensor histidine kinase NarQ
MEWGNWLTPALVFLLTAILTSRLFAVYDRMQEELKREREETAALKEREQLARQLHDGIAQTLFLLSVQVERLKEEHPSAEWSSLEKALRRAHDQVRQSIFNLKRSSHKAFQGFRERLILWIRQFERDTGIPV